MGGYVELLLFELWQTKHSKAQQHFFFSFNLAFPVICKLNVKLTELSFSIFLFSIYKKLFMMNRLIMSQAARKPKDVLLLLVMRL